MSYEMRSCVQGARGNSQFVTPLENNTCRLSPIMWAYLARYVPVTLLASITFGTFTPATAHAFGLGDLIHIGIQAGMRVGGAVVDKAIDSMKDPEAEAEKKRREEEEFQRKAVAGYLKAADEIESRADLTSLQRERLILTLRKQYEFAGTLRQLEAAAESQRKAERDRLLSPAGLAGVAIESAASSPSVAIAQADAMVKAGIPQAQNLAILSRIDNRGHVLPVYRDPYAAARMQTQVDQATQQAIEPHLVAMSQGADQAARAFDQALAAEAPMAVPSGYFAQDYGRRLYVEFSGSQVLTEKLRALLTARGYTLAGDRTDADVTYLFQGEFTMQENSRREGVVEDVGRFFDNPRPIEQPPEKTSGKIKQTLALGFFTLATGGQVAAPPYQPQRQQVLVIAVRQAPGERESRLSAHVERSGDFPQAAEMVDSALRQLFTEIGFDYLSEIRTVSLASAVGY